MSKYFITLCYGAALLIGILDYKTGFELNLIILYLIPITVVASLISSKAAYLISLFCIIVNFLADWDRPYSVQAFWYWNALIKGGVFMYVAFVVGRTSPLISLSQQKMALVQSLLPICQKCNKVVLADGSWQPLEEYIKSRNDIIIAHSICNECTAKLSHESDRLEQGRGP